MCVDLCVRFIPSLWVKVLQAAKNINAFDMLKLCSNRFVYRIVLKYSCDRPGEGSQRTIGSADAK